jgi:hypothetical protein
LSDTQFSTLNSASINDPEGPEKYNNTEVKYGANFYSCHTTLNTRCCETQKSGNILIILRKHQSQQNYMKIADSVVEFLRWVWLLNYAVTQNGYFVGKL